MPPAPCHFFPSPDKPPRHTRNCLLTRSSRPFDVEIDTQRKIEAPLYGRRNFCVQLDRSHLGR